MMSTVLRKVSFEDSEDWQRRLLPRLVVRETDEYRFRKESELPSGLIRWKEGEGLIHAARATLVAGAKAALGKLPHFGNRHGQFANRYLDAVLMGQTAPGSYVVTAYAPSGEGIAMRQNSPETLGLPGVDYLEGREVARAVSNALGAASEALAHFRESSSLSGFEAGVQQGVSYELTNALIELTGGADEAEVYVEWHPGADETRPVSERFDFSGQDTRILEKAAARLVTTEPQPRTVVVGRVHLLTKKEAGLPGVVGLVAIGAAKPKRVRAHLMQASDYHLAVRAHEEDLMIQVVGDLQREGNLNWLYSASVDAVLGPVPESFSRADEEAEVPFDGADDLPFSLDVHRWLDEPREGA